MSCQGMLNLGENQSGSWVSQATTVTAAGTARFGIFDRRAQDATHSHKVNGDNASDDRWNF